MAFLYRFSRAQKIFSQSIAFLEQDCKHLGITFADGLRTKHMVDFLKENCCCRSTSCYFKPWQTTSFLCLTFLSPICDFDICLAIS